MVFSTYTVLYSFHPLFSWPKIKCYLNEFGTDLACVSVSPWGSISYSCCGNLQEVVTDTAALHRDPAGNLHQKHTAVKQAYSANIFEYQKYWRGVFQKKIKNYIYIYIKCYLNNKKLNAAVKHGTGDMYYFMDWPLFSAIIKCNVFIHTGSRRAPSCRKST